MLATVSVVKRRRRTRARFFKGRTPSSNESRTSSLRVGSSNRAAGGNLPPAVRGGVRQILGQSGERRYHFEPQYEAVAIPGGRRGGRRQRHGNPYSANGAQGGSRRETGGARRFRASAGAGDDCRRGHERI